MDIGEIVSGIIKSPFICIGWLIVGAIAGALSRRIMGAKNRPLVNDIILGLLGAVVGGFIGPLLGLYKPGQSGIELYVVNLLVATGGAMLLIFIGRALRR